MPDSVPNPRDVIAEWLIDLVAGTAEEGDLIPRLADAGLVVVPSDEIERLRQVVESIAESNNPVRGFYKIADGLVFEARAALAPYQQTTERDGKERAMPDPFPSHERWEVSVQGRVCSGTGQQQPERDDVCRDPECKTCFPSSEQPERGAEDTEAIRLLAWALPYVPEVLPSMVGGEFANRYADAVRMIARLDTKGERE